MGGSTVDLSPDVQRFAIRGRVWQLTDPGLQDALAQIHDTAERPRCLCMPDGIEMYVARHRHYLVKRMPDTGKTHHPLCPSYEPDNAYSGLGDLVGDAVLETHPGHIELRVHGRAVARGEPDEPGEVAVPRRRMTLRAVLHFLFEQAGFNRWTPAMAGKRNQGVLCKYLLEAAADIEVKGKSLAERLYVPEPFSESAKADIAQRPHAKLAVLQPHDGQAPLALVIGEFKACERGERDCRIWIRHMPDAPLLMDARAWDRLARIYAAMLEARDADTGHPVRLIMAALIRARREFTYEIDAASLMLLSEQWIPVEGVHELPLIDSLIAQKRRFLKPLRYDAKAAAAFPNALLLDCGATPVPLHLISEFMSPKDRSLKEKVIQTDSKSMVWTWHTAHPLPPLPDIAK
jgi:hypothetical protein